MTQGMSLILYPVKDMGSAKQIYRALLGVDPYVDEAYYTGFRLGDDELGLVPNGQDQGMTSPIGFWDVADIEASVKALVDAGATVQQDIKDVGGGKLTASVADADGNITGLVQPPPA